MSPRRPPLLGLPAPPAAPLAPAPARTASFDLPIVSVSPFFRLSTILRRPVRW